MSDDRIIDLGAGWYRVEDGWTEDEIVDDLKSAIRGNMRAERYVRERIREIFASGAAAPHVASTDPRPAHRSGPPSGTGPDLEAIAEAVVANREPDGTWPTQPTVAETLGLTDRRLRQIAAWRDVLTRAEEIAAGR